MHRIQGGQLRRLSIISGLCLLGILAFALGMWTTHKRWTPWPKIEELLPFARSYRDTGMFLPFNSYHRRAAHVPPARYTAYRPDDIAPGFLFVARSVLPENYVLAELIDADGRVVHSWPIRFSAAHDGDRPDIPTHAVEPLPDGTLLANFDTGPGLVRLDPCGGVIWARTDLVFHHSFHADPRGGFWTWAAPGDAESQHQALVRFSAETGETLERIDLTGDVLTAGGNRRWMFGLPNGHVTDTPTTGRGRIFDIFHPNDIEPLAPSLAPAFAGFSPGDLLISLRNLNMVAVLDRETLELKFHAYGPWREQHDPDFQPDGTISILSNNPGMAHSTIFSVDPASGHVRELLEDNGLEFYTDVMGKHDRAANGNWLIVSSLEGRVIETTPSGAPVREYVNLLTDDYNAIVTDARFVAPDFFDALPSCPGN